MIKNHRAILRSDIRSLPVQRGRVMVRPENIQKFVVTDLRRIEFHFHHLGMPGFVRTNISIRWILFRAACVPDRCGHNAFQIAKSFFNAPETACAECGFLRLHTEMMMRLRAARNHTLELVDAQLRQKRFNQDWQKFRARSPLRLEKAGSHTAIRFLTCRARSFP